MYVCALMRLRVSCEVQLQQQQLVDLGLASCSTGGLTLDSFDLKRNPEFLQSISAKNDPIASLLCDHCQVATHTFAQNNTE